MCSFKEKIENNKITFFNGQPPSVNVISSPTVASSASNQSTPSNNTPAAVQPLRSPKGP